MAKGSNKGKLAILVGGGPAPGINGVISAATIEGINQGFEVIGLRDGYKWLAQGDTDHCEKLSIDDVSGIHLRGGSVLGTARTNPTKSESSMSNVLNALKKMGVTALVSIGGDDTGFSASQIYKKAGGAIRVAHVPKTIDNDLPLPGDIPTFGFETAREHATTVVERISEDTRTTGRWFFIVMMGRKAGHLALGAGKAAGATLTLIPEEFPPGPIRLHDVVRVLEGAIVKRLALGRPDGVAVIAEGIAERFEASDLEVLKDAPRDEHGHVRLAEVPLARVLRTEVTKALAARGVKVQIGEKDVGYELRCGQPVAFDRDYTRDLGVGAVRTLLAGGTSVLITRQEGRIVPVPFDELMDPATGRTKVRMVDTSTDSFVCARALQVRVERADLEDATRLAALARAAMLSPEDARKRYAVDL
jgi:6-phosphofructokinase